MSYGHYQTQPGEASVTHYHARDTDYNHRFRTELSSTQTAQIFRDFLSEQ